MPKISFKNSSYFNADLPDYLSFESVSADVAAILANVGTTKFIQKGHNLMTLTTKLFPPVRDPAPTPVSAHRPDASVPVSMRHTDVPTR